jgi:hypothetical protein
MGVRRIIMRLGIIVLRRIGRKREVRDMVERMEARLQVAIAEIDLGAIEVL